MKKAFEKIKKEGSKEQEFSEDAQPREIERKFLVKNLPENLDEYPFSEIQQGYIAIASDGTEIRLRKKDNKYFQIIKSGKGKIRKEIEVEIPKEQFDALWPTTERKRIEKTRYEIPCKNNKIELDVYHKDLEGLTTAEVEFNLEKDSEQFEPPKWFSKEITDKEEYKNQSLAVEGNPLGKEGISGLEKQQELERARDEVKNVFKEQEQVKIFVSEIEKEAKPEYYLKEWKQEMTKRVSEKLETRDKVVINASGASASGKGKAMEELEESLKEQGKKILTISTDDFYKGISKMIMEKILEKNSEIKSDPNEIYKATRSIIGEEEFDEKFTDENIAKIIGYLQETNKSINAEKIKQDIKDEFEKIDFDNPDAVNLDEFNKVISKLKNNKEAEIPKYDMRFGEPIKGEEVNGKNYDIILIEGVYGLNKKILSQSDIQSFIETDTKTLLLRRFRRDVLSGRTTFTPEFTFKFLLETVLPAYKNHILPDRKNADLILKNDYTIYETFDTKTFDVQDKIPVEDAEIEKLEKQWGECLNVLRQEDYYFTNESSEHDPEHLLRVRVENGRLKDLVHKGIPFKRKDEKTIRPTEKYIKEGEFGVHYKNIEEIIQSFKKGGFRLTAQINKNRKIYKKNNIEIAFDEIEGLGNFIELRTNNQISRVTEIDEFKKQYGLEGRETVESYIDEYLDRVAPDFETRRRVETILNSTEIDKNFILENGLCDSLEQLENVQKVFSRLRRGYPNLDYEKQCHGREFREQSNLIIGELVKETLKHVSGKEKAVVLLMPWRAGLAFAESYKNAGFENFYHLSSKRDENTLKTIVDFEGGAEIDKEKTVIIADPMLATGNTIVDAIERAKDREVPEENIIVNSVVGAPIGIARIKKEYPKVKIVTGALDNKLDYKGYIEPGLGDFGDKYFEGLRSDYVENLERSGIIKGRAGEKLIERIKKQGIGEVLKELMERDKKDAEIDKTNREKLVEQGLEIISPKRFLEIDSGKIEGVENVAGIIKSEILDADHRIITLEGISGAGSSSVSEKLQEDLGMIKFSMGEIFRYLTYKIQNEKMPKKEIKGAFQNFNYKIEKGGICLYDGETNITQKLGKKQLSDPKIDSQVPETASLSQKLTIEFMQSELEKLRQKKIKKPILIEGRAFTLDFIPSDMRIKLVADPSIRAERRWAQKF